MKTNIATKSVKTEFNNFSEWCLEFLTETQADIDCEPSELNLTNELRTAIQKQATIKNKNRAQIVEHA